MSNVPARRGRVVMLVDNSVDGDSRVQKSAASVAAAGWEVFLIGRSTTSREDRYALGAATVIRVPVPFTIEGRRRRPGHSLRWPLAYPDQDDSTYGARRQQARQREQQTRTATLAERAERGATRGELLRLQALATLGTLERRAGRVWHGARAAEFSRAVAARRAGTSPADQVAARLWAGLLGDRVWQRLEPRLLDYENAFAPVIDSLAPDVIHGHDFRMVGIAVRAARRARQRGRTVRAVYDAHEFLPGVEGPPIAWHVGHEAYEAAHIRAADAVVTVSPVTARLLTERHHLPAVPTVVTNAPLVDDAAGDGPDPGDVRSAIGLADDVPLLIYVGISAEKRGLRTVVEALPQLAGCHLVLVTKRNPFVAELERRAGELAVADRLHVLPYVEPERLVRFIRTATVGVMPWLRERNHDVTYGTKFFEYSQARLPIVMGEAKAMGDLLRATGNGEMFEPGDVDAFAAAARAVLGNLDRYRKAYDRPGLLESWTWDAQAAVLLELYDRLVATPVGTPVPPVPSVGV